MCLIGEDVRRAAITAIRGGALECVSLVSVATVSRTSEDESERTDNGSTRGEVVRTRNFHAENAENSRLAVSPILRRRVVCR